MSVFRIDYTIDDNYTFRKRKPKSLDLGSSHVVELNDVELLLEKLNNKFIHKNS